MIIVEQNKTYLVNFNNVEHISIAVDEEETEYAIVSVTKSRDEIILGVYETEERAKKVLLEIAERAEGWENLKYGQPKGIAEYIYEMPENRR